MRERPNILLFLTDDHGAWATGCYGNSEVETPTLDALAALGARFDNAYTPCPVCSPARACLLTGKTPSQVGIHDWLQEALPTVGERDWLGQTPTLFDYLSAAGYHTGLSGKWHLGQSHLAPAGADFHFGLPGWQGAHNGRYTYTRDGELIELEGNKSKLITDHAIEFLNSAPADKPFFLNIGYIATHSPYHQQTHDPARTARYQNCEFAAIPPYQPHPWVKNEGGANQLSAEELRDRYIGYYAAVNEIDDNIARVIGALQACGRWDNTIIIYTSDHGCAIGHQGFFGKGNSTRPLNMYEISLRVPLIVSGAGIAVSSRAELVDHYDSFQTVCALAGLDAPPERFCGSAYTDLLAGASSERDRPLFGEYGDLRMARDTRWKLILRYPAGPHALYDLQADPAETINLYARQPAVAARYQALLQAFYAEREDTALSGLRVKELPPHNEHEAWRDGRREARGLQVY